MTEVACAVVFSTVFDDLHAPRRNGIANTAILNKTDDFII